MNPVFLDYSQHQHQQSSLDEISKIENNNTLSKAQGSRISMDKLNQRCANIDNLPTRKTMFNRNVSSRNADGTSDKTNSANSSGLYRNPASNNSYHNVVSTPSLIHGSTGLIMGSSQTAQHQQNRSSLVTQTRALAQQQQQQHRLLQMTKNELEVQQMASNIKESLLIKRRLESIQQLQRQEADKIEAELHLKATAQNVTAKCISGRNFTGLSQGIVSSAAKPIPSISNSSVVPTKQREDEMTKPDLSTLAETAVAVASANNATNAHSSSSGLLGLGSMMKLNINNNTGNNQIAALLSRQASTVPSKKELLSAQPPTSQSIRNSIRSTLSNNAMTDALRRDLNATREKLQLEQSYKRSLDEMSKSNTTIAPSSSSWLWKSATLGTSAPISIDQLRSQHEQLQRRNSLPTPASDVSSEFASLRSLKRQRLLEQKTSEIGGLEFHDAMKQMRRLDAKMKMQMTCNKSLLAEMERRASIASSIASIGTSITAPTFNSNSSLSSPINRRSLVMLESNCDDRAKVLTKLSKMGGGFPMPKFECKTSNAGEVINIVSGTAKSKIPAEITPELGKDVVDIIGRESLLSVKNRLENDKQSRYLERIGGFPMPPLYKNNDDNHITSRSNNELLIGQENFDGAINVSDPGTRSKNNAISSHIRNNLNRSGNKASRPPTLESYKRVWRDIRVEAGDDPLVDERLRKEVFARKLERGQILVGKMRNNNMNSMNNLSIDSCALHRRLSELSQGSDNGNTSNNSGRTKCGDTSAEESIVI